MQHLSAWYESIDPGGVLTPITAVPEQQLFSSGDDIRVPDGMGNIIMQAALANDASGTRAQVQSPSLRSFANIDVEPLVLAAVFGSPPEILFHPSSPIPVSPGESINMALQSNPAGAVDHYGLVQFSDGPVQPVEGNIYSIRATGTAALSAGQWVNTTLSFAQTLPVGRYQVVGLRARGTNLVAARLVFVGGAFRPGVPAVNAIGDTDASNMRYGRPGVLGEFDTNTPPTMDCLGITDTSQSFVLDVIKVA